MPAFRVSDLAKRWQCSEGKIRTMIRRGELKALPFTGKLIRVAEDEVLRWEQSEPEEPMEETQEQKRPSKEAVDLAIRVARMVARQPR